MDKLFERQLSRRDLLMLGAGLAGGLLVKTVTDSLPNIEVPLMAKRKEILGFAPHWVIDDLADNELDSLTTLAYFNLPIGGDGNLMKSNSGYITLQSEESNSLFERLKKNKQKVMLTVAVEDQFGLMNSRDIASLMNDKESKKRAIENIISEMRRHKLDSINIDFEYWGEVNPELRDNFSEFIEELKIRSGSRITVAVYASSVSNYHIFDVKKLSRVSDGLVVMAYDFYSERAKIVAPTAPLYGAKEGRYWYDVSEAVKHYRTLVPAEKIILGIPQYGHDYPVYKDEDMAWVRPGFYLNKDTYIGPQTLTMHSLRERLRRAEDIRESWDDIAKVNRWSYILNYDGVDIRRMVYMEDQRSIAEKCDLVLEQGLGGIAFWASGFNSDDQKISQVIKSKFG